MVSLLLIVHGVLLLASHRGAALPLSQDFSVRGERRFDGAHLDQEERLLACRSPVPGEMVGALREKIGQIETHHAQMAPQLERLKAAAARGALREVEQEADRLRATVEQLAQAMEPFQTKSEPAEPHPRRCPPPPDSSRVRK